MNYEDHNKVLELLKKDQEAEEDLRKEIDEVIHFLHHPQGQWETNIWQEFAGRPRYTFDQCKPAIGKVWAEMAANEYTFDFQPVGGGASEEVSNFMDGLVRNIKNISAFDDISTKAGKRMISTGYAAWRVVAKYASPDCFYQDLVIIPINNAHRRVWFDCNAELQSKDDAMHVHYLSNLNSVKAEELAGRPVQGLDDNRSTDSYTYKPSESVIIGEILYKKEIKKTIYLIEDEESSVVDDEGLENMGLTPDDALDSRDIKDFQVFSRKFDNKGWIGEPKATVFSHLPIIPEYANFDINEDGKTTYEGMVRSVMDHQRVFNYAESRKVEESVLAPRKKIFMDNRVAEGYEDELGNLNRDPRAIQLFNGKGAEMSNMPIYESRGPEPNPAVTEVANDMIRNFQLSLGLPNELEISASTRKDSDFRFDQRTSMGQVGTFEYYRSHKVALEHTAKVILDAIPKVYDTFRKVRTIDEAGQSSEVEINAKDRATGKVINDLSVGKYDVCVKISRDFESRQAEANSAILQLGQINPEVVARNTDIIATNIKAPGMRTVADREREFLFKQGMIPEGQLTDEEKETLMAQQQQEAPPDPGVMIAQAEMQKAQTQLLIEQAKLEQKQLELQIKAQERGAELEIKQRKQESDELSSLIQGAKTLAEIDQMDAQSKELSRQNTLINQNQSDL